MTVRIGLIGAGAMGAGHVETIVNHVPGARVVEVFDFDTTRAADVAKTAGAAVAPSAEKLITSADVDAVVIASPDSTHPDLVLACLAAGVPVLCEKPLATTSAEAWRVVEAEIALGQQLVQVGFMRRYDPGYLELKNALTTGLIGEAVVVHHLHRNPSSATSATDAGIVTGSMIHELDVAPWLLDSPVRSIRIVSPRTTGLKDPQLAWIHHESGAMSTAEVFVNAAYGYDVRCEVVATRGVAELPARPTIGLRTGGQDARAIRPDFVAHFAEAYRAQMASWVHQVGVGAGTGPSAWDGFVATAVAEAGVTSLATGTEQEVNLPVRPELYRREQVLA